MHLPETQPFEDPQNEDDAPATRPLRMAMRNSAAALLGIGLLGLGFWLKINWYGQSGHIYWWIWPAVAAFAVAVCFVHAIVAAKFGGHVASVILKGVAVLALAGILFAVWWSLQPKNGGV